MKQIPPPPRSVLKSSTALESAVQVLEEYQDYLRSQAAAAAQRDRTGQAPRGLPTPPARAPPQVWLRTPEAAAHLGLSISSLSKWRCAGKGPRYAKLIGSVVYSLQDLDAWASACKRGSTSDAGNMSDARRRAIT
jgi:hypothetical protein